MKDLEKFLTLQMPINDVINTGILRRIEDSRAGRVSKGGQALIENLQNKLEKKLSSKI